MNTENEKEQHEMKQGVPRKIEKEKQGAIWRNKKG